MMKSLVIASLFVAAFGSAAAADPVRLRIGWAQVPTQMTPGLDGDSRTWVATELAA